MRRKRIVLRDLGRRRWVKKNNVKENLVQRIANLKRNYNAMDTEYGCTNDRKKPSTGRELKKNME
jgi:hypothetical protein